MTAFAERSELAATDLLPVLERLAGGLGLQVSCRKGGHGVLTGPAGTVVETWREG